MKNIIVLYGGESVEHEVSIITGLQAIENLNSSKYRIVPVYIRGSEMFVVKRYNSTETYKNFNASEHKKVYLIDSKLCTFRRKKMTVILEQIDCALCCTHGGTGENGALQGMLEMFNLAYTSSGILTSSVAADKYLTKLICRGLDIPFVACERISKRDYSMGNVNLPKVVESISLPLIVKPNSLGSSIGVKVVESLPELIEALRVAFSYDDEVLLEKYIANGCEYNCAAIGTLDEIIIGDVEIPLSSGDILSFADKYQRGEKGGEKQRIIPDEFDEVAVTVKRTTKRLLGELGIKGTVRVDFLYDKTSETLFVNELNVIPGSLAFYLFKDKNLEYSQILDLMIDNAQKGQREKEKLSRAYSNTLLYNNNFSKG